MIEIENKLYEKGYKSIACIDEVGRGCLFGDVVACAIIMPMDLIIPEVKDSKKLSPKKREALYDIILENSMAYGIGRVDSKTIDDINIRQATLEAMKLAVDNLKDKDGKTINPDFLLIDAETVNVDIDQKGIKGGDNSSHGIACASIIAKVYRDKLCNQWNDEYPEYKIGKHKGYGTKAHIQALKEHGPSDLHRHTFLRKILKG